jgi:cytidylate kinase
MLGYRYFDKELMAQVASEVGLAEEGVVDFSEDNYKVQNFLERLFGIPRRVAQESSSTEGLSKMKEPVIMSERYPYIKLTEAIAEQLEEPDEIHSITLVQGAIRAAYEYGNVVIVGRGGQATLKDLPNVLHVRIQASLDARVRRLHDRANFSWGGAQDRAIKRDRASAEYLKRFYGIDWNDPMLYDLVINTDKLGSEAAAQIIANAAGHLPPAEASA